jgi:16S rRNA (adenine1518-N6/adenine1519-N6)-dimethyltransferase
LFTEFCEQFGCIRAPNARIILHLMKLSEMRQTLRELEVAPVKTLGQNFLFDQNLARWIVQQAQLSTNDFVLEIGPGLGALTAPALATGASVLAIEKDGRLANFLRQSLDSPRLEIVHGDALDFEVKNLFPRGPIKLLGNLPYYISSEILVRYLQTPTPIVLALLMLQKEVAIRLAAGPGSKDYGILGLVLQSQYRVEYLRTVPASVFFPQPDVDSAFVRLSPRPRGELPEHDRSRFLKLVRRGFSQRRKQVGKLLAEIVPAWPEAAQKIGAAVQARAEDLSLAQWISLTNWARPPAPLEYGNDPTEKLAVVDENDLVIGALPRAEVHGNNLRHRAVHIFLFNRAGELLLQKRSPWKDRHPELWDSSAAGHVNAGEEFDQTAVRELKEELGVETKLTRVARLAACEATGQEFIWLYRGDEEMPFAPAASEIDALEFFPLRLIAEWIEKRPSDFAPGFIACWRASGLCLTNSRA